MLVKDFDTDLADARLEFDPQTTYTFSRVRFERVDLSRGRPNYISVDGSAFVECDFSRFRSRIGGTMGGGPALSTYFDCTFDSADLRSLFPGFARFERCQFTNVRIHDWSTYRTSFVDCVFSGRISQTVFWGSDPLDPHAQVNDFIGNDFSAADLVDTNFRRGIDLRRQRLPAGPAYLLLDRWPERLERARAAILDWPIDAQRRKVMEMIDDWTGDTPLIPVQLIHRTDLAEYVPQATLDRLWDLLSQDIKVTRSLRE